MNFIKKYKERNCKTKIGKFLQRMVFDIFLQLKIFISLILFGGIINNFSNSIIFVYIYTIGIFGIVIFSTTWILYAFIIQPIIKYFNNNNII